MDSNFKEIEDIVKKYPGMRIRKEDDYVQIYGNFFHLLKDLFTLIIKKKKG